MTERSIVVSDNQLMIMLEGEEDQQNTSVNVMLKDFKKMFEDRKSNKKLDVNSSCSQISDNSRMYNNYQTISTEKLVDESVANRTTSCKCQLQGNSDEKVHLGRQNYTARDNLDIGYDILNEIFQEFKEEKYGIRNDGQRTVQHKELNESLNGERPRLPLQQFINLKNFRSQHSGPKNSGETQEEREKRLFERIRQRQSLMNASSIFRREDQHSQSCDNQDTISNTPYDRSATEVFLTENSIGFENVNTSTFGYAMNHNQRRNDLNHSAEPHSNGLDNDNGTLSTTKSNKLNKRYINSPVDTSQSIIKSYGSSKKSRKDSSFGSDVDPIVIYGDESEQFKGLREELLQRILTRNIKHSEILDLKAGYAAFIKNCIRVKQTLNLLHKLEKVFVKRDYKAQAMFVMRLQELSKIHHGAKVVTKTVTRQAFKRLKQHFETKKRHIQGVTKLRRFFLNQALSKQFIQSLHKMSVNQSSNSLIAPLQNRSLIVDAVSKEEVKSGLKILKSVFKSSSLRVKRSAFNEVIEHSTSQCKTEEEEHSEE